MQQTHAKRDLYDGEHVLGSRTASNFRLLEDPAFYPAKPALVHNLNSEQPSIN